MLTVKITAGHEPSYWLRSTVDNVLTMWQLVKPPEGCAHPPQKSVGFTSLWLPERLVCSDCAQAVFALDGAADHECDRCHKQSDDVVAVVLDLPMSSSYRLVISLGLCPTCLAKEGLR